MTSTIPGPDGRPRCSWSTSWSEYLAYHDREWGFPVADDRRLFEKLCLEGFQSGLSWRTILAKRENFRAAFAGFDFDAVAALRRGRRRAAAADAGIVRHRGKIEAAINNARRARELIAEAGSLAAFVWSFEPAAATSREPQTASTSAASVALSKDAEEARLGLRRPDHGLRLHAGDGPGQRPRRRLRHPPRSRRRPRRLPQALNSLSPARSLRNALSALARMAGRIAAGGHSCAAQEVEAEIASANARPMR